MMGKNLFLLKNSNSHSIVATFRLAHAHGSYQRCINCPLMCCMCVARGGTTLLTWSTGYLTSRCIVLLHPHAVVHRHAVLCRRAHTWLATTSLSRCLAMLTSPLRSRWVPWPSASDRCRSRSTNAAAMLQLSHTVALLQLSHAMALLQPSQGCHTLWGFYCICSRYFLLDFRPLKAITLNNTIANSKLSIVVH